MKQLSIFLLLLTPVFGFSQHTILTDENGQDYMAGVVLFKVAPEFRSACTDDAVAIPALLEEIRELEFVSLEKKFKSAVAPASEYNERGQKLADISLIYELKIPDDKDVFLASKKLAELSAIVYAEPKYVSYDQYTPNDANLNSVMPYHFDNVEAYAAWDITLGDTNVVIGITDTSFDNDHEDMSGNIKYNYDDPIGGGDDDADNYIDNYAGWDMVDDDNNLFINNEIHGTAVGAIASATADNGIGYAGIGFKCKFLPVKVADNSQVITHGYEGIEYCVEQGCDVINCSWGNTTFSQVAQDVIAWAAINNDVVIVASAGNDDATAMYYPASYNYVMSVTGVNSADVFDNGSNPPFTRNDSVDVSAPGYSVYTTATFGGNPLYAPPQGGTSMAGPIVAGVAGLVRSQFPCLTALEVIEQIKSTADNIDAITQNVPYAGLLGTGRVNAEMAVSGDLCGPVGGIRNLNGFDVTVYPNPSQGFTVVRTSLNTDWELHILDTKGRLILSRSVQGNRTEIDGLAAGYYVAQIQNEQGVVSKQFVVTE